MKSILNVNSCRDLKVYLYLLFLFFHSHIPSPSSRPLCSQHTVTIDKNREKRKWQLRKKLNGRKTSKIIMTNLFRYIRFVWLLFSSYFSARRKLSVAIIAIYSFTQHHVKVLTFFPFP